MSAGIDPVAIAIAKAASGGGGGGGGGGGSDIFVVTYTDNAGTLTYDKTFDAIYEAYQTGALVIAKFMSAYILLGGIEFEAPDEPTCMNFYTFSTNDATVSVFHIYHYAAYGSDPEEALYTIVDLTGTVRT